MDKFKDPYFTPSKEKWKPLPKDYPIKVRLKNTKQYSEWLKVMVDKKHRTGAPIITK